MKRIFKILGLIAAVLFAALVGLVILGCIVGSDEQTDSEIYTYTPEAIAKYQPLFPPWGPSDASQLTDAVYYDTMEEAISHDEALAKADEEQNKDADMLNHVTEVLKTWEGREYVTIFYRAENADNSKQGLVFVKCSKKDFDGKTKYAFVNSQYSIQKPDSKYIIHFEKDIGQSLVLSDAMQDLNPNYPDTRFICGFSHNESIYSLEVEGQKPDGIIELDVYGRTLYLWYYNNLKSDKAGGSLSYRVHRAK